MKEPSVLFKSLGYEFSDQELLTSALTHRSRHPKNYERLEFLGDSILGMIIAEHLYHTYPDSGEGKLSRMRSSLVRKESLAEIARNLNLQAFLILGEGELKSGGFNRDSILADVVESLIGAIYLEGGLHSAKQVVLDLYSEKLDQLSPDMTHKDSKSRLQETLQKKGLSLPQYQIINIGGKQHDQIFTVSCSVNDLDLCVQASEKSSRKAEQAAAKLMLDKISTAANFISQ